MKKSAKVSNFFLLCLVYCCALGHAFAQKTGNIIGVVKDKETQETLVGATVVVQGTQLSAATDIDGKFNVE